MGKRKQRVQIAYNTHYWHCLFVCWSQAKSVFNQRIQARRSGEPLDGMRQERTRVEAGACEVGSVHSNWGLSDVRPVVIESSTTSDIPLAIITSQPTPHTTDSQEKSRWWWIKCQQSTAVINRDFPLVVINRDFLLICPLSRSLILTEHCKMLRSISRGF